MSARTSSSAALAWAALALIGAVSASVEDTVYRGEATHYPAPTAVVTVPRAAQDTPASPVLDPGRLAEAARGSANGAVRVRVTGARVAGRAEGDVLLDFTTEWQNVHPPARVRRGALEGKADRTMGAGGLLGGGWRAAGGGAGSDTVLRDVAYRIPRWGDHVVLLADGVAVPLDPASARLPDGADPAAGMTLARRHDTRRVRFRFRVPERSRWIALHLFDYANGHVTLPLKGDPDPGGTSATLAGDTAGPLVLALDDPPGRVVSAEAPAGWRRLTVRLLGRSLVKRRGKGSIVQVGRDALWLQDGRGFLHGAAPATMDPLRFFPEYPTRVEAHFLLPEGARPARMLLRAGERALALDWPGAAEPALPEAAARWRDGELAEFALLGVAEHAGARVLDLAVHNLAAGKGLELDLGRQFRLTRAGTSLRPDRRKTAALVHGAPDRLVVPPGAVVRFLVAFPARAGDEWRLDYRGFRQRHRQALAAPPAIPETVLATRLAFAEVPEPSPQKRVPAPSRSAWKTARWPAAEAGGLTGETKAPPPRGGPARPAAAAQSGLEGFEVVEEVEPNDEPARAMPVQGDRPRAVRGRLEAREKRRDEDHFVLQTGGAPQLWDVVVEGRGVGELGYLDPGGRMAARARARREAPARLAGLYLLPGRHRFQVTAASRKGGDYVLRFLPRGVPDPSAEREPNDAVDRAQPVVFGRRYRGVLTPGDEDRYRFWLDAAARIRLHLEAGPGGSVRASLGDEARRRDVLRLDRRRNDSGVAVREVQLAHGDYTLRVRGDPGDYAFRLERHPPWAPEGPEAAVLALRFLDAPPTWAAFEDRGQAATVRLEIVNRGAQPRALHLKGWFSRWDWQAVPEDDTLRLEAGGAAAVPVRILAPPDIPSGEPVELWLGVADGETVQAAARLAMPVVCGAEVQGPRDVWPVPEPLRGGLDVAWRALGARLVGGGDARKAGPLIDGLTTPPGARWRWDPKKDPAPEVTVRLAGEAPVPVAGFLFHPMGCDGREMPGRFEVLLSQDGERFQSVLTGRLADRAVEQAFVLDAPVPARSARLRMLDAAVEAGSVRTVCLGEWKVVAAPDYAPSASGFDLADAALGGHLVWAAPHFDAGPMLRDDERILRARADGQGRLTWVLGFHHDRAARVTALAWRDWPEKARRGDPAIERVRVSFSTESPLGPWRGARDWTVAGQGPARLALDAPVWARFVRFEARGLEPGRYHVLPARLSVFEAPPGAEGYRSILGEWGHYRQRAQYEAVRETVPETGENRQGTRERPVALRAGVAVPGRVRLGADEDWYRLEVPAGRTLLELRLESDAVFRLAPTLFDEAGDKVPWLKAETAGGATVYQAQVAPGGYRLRVRELPRSVVVAWDQSGSVADYHPVIHRALARFARSIAPQAEYLNFLPFADTPRLLLEAGSDQTEHLLRALNDYDRRDSSSRAETNLIAAAEALAKRRGERIVVVITDAESGEEATRTEPLWRALAEARPRIFSIELHRGDQARGQQDRMQDWAMANRGRYDFFREPADLDAALARALCKVRRPARYTVAAQFARAEPGRLRLAPSRRAAAGAIELILDASGSMYKRLAGGRTRIDAAKAAVIDLVRNVIPPGTPVALRVYGHKAPRSCRTDLEVPLSPLDPARVERVVRRIRPQDRSRTPLAASIRQVAQDLAGAEGRRLVLLFTDGKESCGGDPEAAIRALQAQGVEVELNIVGLAIQDQAARSAFERWAAVGGGRYFQADDAETLAEAMKAALQPRFEVMDAAGKVVARGTVGGEAVELAPGTYRVQVSAAPPVSLEAVVVQPGRETVLALDPSPADSAQPTKGGTP